MFIVILLETTNNNFVLCFVLYYAGKWLALSFSTWTNCMALGCREKKYRKSYCWPHQATIFSINSRLRPSTSPFWLKTPSWDVAAFRQLSSGFFQTSTNPKKNLILFFLMLNASTFFCFACLLSVSLSVPWKKRGRRVLDIILY